jgi:hypothetical protein
MSIKTRIIILAAIVATITGLGLTLTKLQHTAPVVASAVWGS